MQFSWLKDHLGFTITILGAGIGAAIWKGNSATATVIAAVIVLGAASVIGSRRDSSSGLDEEAKFVEPGPFLFTYTWQLNVPPDMTGLERELCARGLEVDRGSGSESKLILHRGSQFRTRLLGGYFVNPRFLPLRVEVKADCEPGGKWVLHALAQDTLGVAIRDAAAKNRYALSAAEIANFVEESLKVPRWCKMSDLAAFCTGMGIGLLIIVPVAYACRREIAERARGLFRGPDIEGDDQNQSQEASERTSGDLRPQGLSLGGALFCICASTLTLVWGLVSGGPIFILSGAILGIAVLLTFVASKTTQDN